MLGGWTSRRRGRRCAANLRGLGLVVKAAPGLGARPPGPDRSSPAGRRRWPWAPPGGSWPSSPRRCAWAPTRSPGREVRSALLLIAGAMFLSQLVGPLQQAVLFGLQRKFEAYLSRRLMTATVALPGLAYFEDPEFRDELAVAHWIGYGPVHTLQFLSPGPPAGHPARGHGRGRRHLRRLGAARSSWSRPSPAGWRRGASSRSPAWPAGGGRRTPAGPTTTATWPSPGSRARSCASSPCPAGPRPASPGTGWPA